MDVMGDGGVWRERGRRGRGRRYIIIRVSVGKN